jgi:sialate O-acetylesterase
MRRTRSALEFACLGQLLAFLSCVGAIAQTAAPPQQPATAQAVGDAAARPEPALALASMFSDHMVLQRDLRVPVWGRAERGAQVTVTLDGKSATATADDDGAWRASLEPHAAGGPFELVVSAGDHKLTLGDVLVGDVWIASGQSNMEWPVAASNDAEAENAAADFPQIRFIDVPNVVGDAPRTEFENAAWEVCEPGKIGRWSAVAYFFGRELNRELKVPIGLVGCNWGGTPMEAWTSREALESSDTFDAALADDAREPANDEEAEARRRGAQNRPARLFNGMLSAVVPYGIRGVIWYQGESNAGRHQEYAELTRLMIGDWRNRWGQGDFPFFVVQLAGWEPGGESWPFLREAQVDALSVPNTGMALAIDIGDRQDIHPRNKQEVGRRLALAARAIAYDDDVVYSGPTFKEVAFDGGKARLTFDHIGGGLMAGREGGELKGFEIAAADGKFVPAKASVDGEAVVAWSDAIADPKAVRYNWAAFPDGNLTNAEGLPAVPFRSHR